MSVCILCNENTNITDISATNWKTEKYQCEKCGIYLVPLEFKQLLKHLDFLETLKKAKIKLQDYIKKENGNNNFPVLSKTIIDNLQ